MLEASPKGLGVYQSVGFKRFGEGGDDGRGEIWVDLERWAGAQDRGVEFTEERIRREPRREGEGWYAQVLMVRPAKAGGGSGKVGNGAQTRRHIIAENVRVVNAALQLALCNRGRIQNR